MKTIKKIKNWAGNKEAIMKKNKGTKAYKAFNNDWTCNGFQYEVGKTYEYDGEIEICKSGFHACLKIEDCFEYYDCVPWNKFAEVEILGDIETHEQDSKVCTNKIKIVREIPFDSIKKIIESTGIVWSTGIVGSEGIVDSTGIVWSTGIVGSEGIVRSEGIVESEGIVRSEGIVGSTGIVRSEGIVESEGIVRSEGIVGSTGIVRSEGIVESEGIVWSTGIVKSFGVNNSNGVANAIFLADKKPEYTIFNKPVDENRYEQVWNELKWRLNGWYPRFNNLHYLYFKSGSRWEKTPITNAEEIQKEEAWKDMPKEAIDYLVSLPEFDSEIFYKVTGIRLEEK